MESRLLAGGATFSMGLAGLVTILLVAIPKTIIILGFPLATTIIATEVARSRAEQRLRARARQRSLARCVTQTPQCRPR